MNLNIAQLLQLLASGNSDPQQLILNLLQNQAGSNPILANLLRMAQTGNTQDIEQVARNIVSSQGKDFDTEFNNFKRQYGLS